MMQSGPGSRSIIHWASMFSRIQKAAYIVVTMKRKCTLARLTGRIYRYVYHKAMDKIKGTVLLKAAVLSILFLDLDFCGTYNLNNIVVI